MLINPATSKDYEIVTNHHWCETRRDKVSGQQTLFALRDFQEGELISNFGAAFVSSKPSYLTVQVGYRKHIALHPYFLQHINHGCDPNCFFDTTLMQVVALKPIANGEEFTFFYPSTEWTMASPFQCYCNKPGCLGLISGSASIPEEILTKYRLSDFIRNKLKNKMRKAS